jgi:hypothetical protein
MIAGDRILLPEKVIESPFFFPPLNPEVTRYAHTVALQPDPRLTGQMEQGIKK